MNPSDDESSHEAPTRRRYRRADPDAPSRGERRREALSVLALAHALADLSDAELSRIPLDHELREMVEASRAVRQHIARKRQLAWLAKQLRNREDQLPPIRAALERHQQNERAERARLHRAEAWRDRLIADGDAALMDLLADHPDVDRQQYRTLIRRAREETAQGKPPAAARALFRHLVVLLDSAPD